jgi:hypothetical protein
VSAYRLVLAVACQAAINEYVRAVRLPPDFSVRGVQVFPSAFEHLATAPISLSFQAMPFLFHDFATTDLIASDPFLLFVPLEIKKT